MKLIFVAREAFEAYLIISALARSVVAKGTATLGRGSSSVGGAGRLTGRNESSLESEMRVVALPSTSLSVVAAVEVYKAAAPTAWPYPVSGHQLPPKPG